MKVSFFPTRIPKELDWRWTPWLFLAGLLFVLRAAIAKKLHDSPEAVVAWIGVALLCFAAAYRGRAESLYRALTNRAASPDDTRLQAMGLATAGFIHELKNATTVLHGYAQIARSTATAEGASERLQFLLQELDRQADQLGEALKRDLELGVSAPATSRPIGDCFQEIVQLLGPIARQRSLHFESTADPGVERMVQDPQFRQALLNLGLNAIASARSSVRVQLTLDDTTAIISVEDDGPGVDPAIASRLFEPFASDRPGGTGLGLAQVRTAVEHEGGTAHVGQGASGGARAEIRLPNARKLEPPSPTA